ncbi:MAG: AAA family ATPase [Acidobacteria bacterium]|nr:AAA family ATPase [Acidobacteriota bacterium]
MIRTLKIERFKSLVKLELELGQINVFIGANGSGKSNLLEGLGVLGAAASGRVDDEALLRRGVRPGVPKLYKAAFPTKDKVPHLTFGATSNEGARYEVNLWNPISDPEPAWRFKTERLNGAEGKKVVTRGVKTHGKRNQEQGLAALGVVNLEPGDAALTLMDELRGYRIHCPNTPTLRSLVQDQQSQLPVGLAGGRLPETITEILSAAKKKNLLLEVLDEVRDLLDWASDFSAGPSIGLPLSPSAARSPQVIKFEDRFMAKRRNKLTGYDASEGALYILFAAVLALHPKSPSCLAVDNLDQALNPRLAQRLMTALCSWTVRLEKKQQWLITVHNPAILDGLPLNNPEIRLFTVDRNNHGHTVVRHIDLATALKARPNAEWTLSRMWMTSLLGGVPNV